MEFKCSFRYSVAGGLAAAAGARRQLSSATSSTAKPEGVDLKLDFVRPGEGAGPFPLVICIHGGGWQSGSKSGYAMALGVLAQNGYAGASVEYRLAPQVPVSRRSFRTCVMAVQYLREHATEFKVDPNRIAVLGDSAGGHLASAARRCRTRRMAIRRRGQPLRSDRSRPLAGHARGRGGSGHDLAQDAWRTSSAPATAPPRCCATHRPINRIGKAKPAVLTFHGDCRSGGASRSRPYGSHEALRKAGTAGEAGDFEGRVARLSRGRPGRQ